MTEVKILHTFHILFFSLSSNPLLTYHPPTYPHKHHTQLGRMSLLDFAESNQKQGSVAKVLVDKSYFVDPQISTNYFMCLADSIIRLSDMAYNLCSCLLLSIFKLGDPNAEVRRYAVRLVHYLCQKVWNRTFYLFIFLK